MGGAVFKTVVRGEELLGWVRFPHGSATARLDAVVYGLDGAEMGGTHLLMIESIAMAGLEGAVQRHNEQILRPAPAGLNSASDDEESSAGEADD